MLRPLVPQDLDSLFSIFEDAQAASAVSIAPRWSLAQFSEEMAHLGWVSQGADGTAEAFILFRDVGEAFEISFLATASSALRQGLMEQLFLHLLKNRTEPKAVWLEVHEANLPARALYKKIGFTEVGRRPNYYADGGAAVLYNYG